MTGLFRWSDATAEDRTALQSFSCTLPQVPRFKPPYRLPPDREWEYQVRGFVRSMKPPAPPGQMMLLGKDDLGLGAVAWTENVDGPTDVFIRVMALASRARNLGAGHADEMFEEMKDRLADRVEIAGADHLILTAKVDPRNEASRHLGERSGASVFAVDDPFEMWVLPIIIG